MRSVDIPITPRTRALIVRYEHDRPVIEAAARDALIHSGVEGDRDVVSVVLHPHDWAHEVHYQRREEDWAWAFEENERFAAALVQKEAELGVDHLPVHLFGCAPLALMLHLASCLPRRPLRVYQQAPDGQWSPGYDKAQPPGAEDFFQVEGLPAARQGGRGHVALIVEVTRSIRDKALAELQARYPSQLLATVCLRPVAGPSPGAVRSPQDAARAAEQLRAVLDALHERLEGAESVLLAMDCPASFAAALGASVNPNAQHPLRLHHFSSEPGLQQYVPVHLLTARRRQAAPRTWSVEEQREAMQVLGDVRRVHESLVAWLNEPAQKPLVEQMDGDSLLVSKLADVPAIDPEPFFRHLGGTWNFSVDLLLGLSALRRRLGSVEDWNECVRLFLVHEVFHVRQGGLTSYNYSGSGRTGYVLEAVDYDADAVSIDVALAWRMAKQAGAVRDAGRTRTLEAIIWNAVENLRIFEQERPVRDLSERRLRRYLIWLFQACRLSILARRGGAEAGLERVTLEVAGLRTFPDPYERYRQSRVSLLDAGGSREPVELAVYFQRRLVRDAHERDWVFALLGQLSRWDEQPREASQERMRLHFEHFFNRHRELLRP